MEPSNPQRIPLETMNPQAPPPPVPEPPASETPPPTPEQYLDFDARESMREKIVAALQTCFDPEIPVNIYELGLIYTIDISDTGFVNVKMTLTSPACPAAGSLPPEVRNKVKTIPGVTDAKVDVVWDPPWHQGLMSDAARLQLGLDDF